MAQHGDLQLPIIDARADEQSEEPAQEAIQEEREHGRSPTGSRPRDNAACQRPDRICLPHTIRLEDLSGGL
jgi:hypothetical protein